MRAGVVKQARFAEPFWVGIVYACLDGFSPSDGIALMMDPRPSLSLMTGDGFSRHVAFRFVW